MSLSPDLERRITEDVRVQVRRDPDAALESARRVRREAVDHKRAAEHYRRKSKVANLKFAAFKKALEEIGVQVIIESPSPRRTK